MRTKDSLSLLLSQLRLQAALVVSERQSSKPNVYHIGLGTMEISNYAYTGGGPIKASR